MTDETQPTERPQPRAMRDPSTRLVAVLAVAMLAIGVAAGAAIGPAPAASLGQGLPLPVLLPRVLAAAGVGRQPTSAATAPNPLASKLAPRKHRRKRRHPLVRSAASTPTTTSETSPPSSSSKPAATPKTKKVTLAPVTNVWLIELSGSTFEGAIAAPTTAPYIDTQAIPAGELLGGDSALDGSALASDAALLGGTPPQVLETIVQPPCTEGAAAEPCLDGTPAALSAADSFLSQTVPTITSTAAYRSNGLVVITFGNVGAGAAAGLPAGSTTATLTATPPAGVLLLSPFATPAGKSTATFDPSSPVQSLAKVLHK